MRPLVLALVSSIALGCSSAQPGPAVDGAVDAPPDAGPDLAEVAPPLDASDAAEAGAADGDDRPEATDGPTSGWRTLPDLPVPRLEVGVAALRGQIYVVGGTLPASATPTTAVHAFDPASNRWLEKRALAPPGLSHANLAVLGDRLFLLGPDFTGQVYEYDPDGDLWTARAANQLEYTERGASAVGVIDGKIYVAVGGFGSRVFAVYDPAANSWQALPPLAIARDHVAGAVIGHTLYVIGGTDRLNLTVTDRVEAYDVAVGTWVAKTAMPTARSGCAGVVLGDEIVVLGGEGDPGTGRVYATVEAYDPATDRWRTLPPMKTARHGLGAAVVDGTIYAPGGSTSMDVGPGGQTFEAYTP